MTKKSKLVDKFLKSPDSVSYSDLEKILLYLGFEKIYAKGSHRKFKHQLLAADLVIPVHGNDCKSFYKKQAYKVIIESSLYL